MSTTIPQPGRLRSGKKNYIQMNWDHCPIGHKGPGVFYVYYYLSMRVGNHDSAWPTLRKMTADLHMSTTTIMKNLDILIEEGLLRVIPGNQHKPNTYIVYDPSTPWHPDGHVYAETPEPVATIDEHVRTPTIPPIPIVSVSELDTSRTPASDTEETTAKEQVSTRDTHVSLAAAKPQREASPNQLACRALWAALEQAFGWAPAPGTTTASGWNGIVKQLRLENATPEDIPRMLARWPDFYPKATCTPFALGNHAAELLRGQPMRASPASSPLSGVDAITQRAKQISNRGGPVVVEASYRAGGG